MDAEDLAQVDKSLRRATRGLDVEGVRRAVTDFGWYELLAEDPHAAVSTLFTLQGDVLLPGSFLNGVMLAEAGVAEASRVALPPLDHLQPTSTLCGRRVQVEGIVQHGDGTVLVPCLSDGTLALVGCAAENEEPPGDALDPAAGWHLLRGDLHIGSVLLDGAEAEQAWTRMAAVGRRALAHELVATTAVMLRLTVEHVTIREQFGRPLGAFQTVKHALADVRLWQESAALAAAAAWEDRGPGSAALAKALACRASRTARQNCQQLLGGMGFTWEHPFHRYLRRALTLEPLLGGARVQQAELGRALRHGIVPMSLAQL